MEFNNVDYRGFITGFDVKAYVDAVNAEWKQREAALKKEISTANVRAKAAEYRVDNAESRLEQLRKDAGSYIKRIDTIHAFLGKLGMEYDENRGFDRKPDGLPEFVHCALLQMADAWTKPGQSWPWYL